MVKKHFRNNKCEVAFDMPECWKCDIPVASGGAQHKGITQNWTDSILNGTPLLAPGEEGIKGLMLSTAMLLSAWTDNWVDLPIDEELFYEQLQARINESQIKKLLSLETR